MRNVLALLLLTAACGSKTPPTAPPAPPSDNSVATAKPMADDLPPIEKPTKPVTTKSLAAIGLDPDALDRTADPCDDFYQFSCGGYIAKTEIPADKPLTMRSFVSISDRNLEYEKSILETASTKPGDDAILKQLGAFYGSCMNETAIEKTGLAPIKPLLAQIDKVHDAKSLSAAVTTMHVDGMEPVFTLGPTQDSADATREIADIEQGGIGLRDRDYYLKDDDQTKKVRGAYHDYVVSLLVDAGRKPDDAAKGADAVIALETEFAKVSKDKVARRDPKGMYNRLDRPGVAKAMAHFDWDGFWKGVGLGTVKEITVGSPEFLTGIDPLIASTPMSVWRDYLTVAALRSSTYLTKKLEDQSFAFRAVITGQKEQEPRWKRCAEKTDGALGDLLGQAFVRDKFGGQSKQAAEEQVHAIVTAMTANLAALPWMDDATKAKAAAKLNAMTYQIGYPKKWRTYSFKLDGKTWGANVLAANRAEQTRQLAKIGKPVDRAMLGSMTVADQRTPTTTHQLNEHRVPGRHPAAAVLQRRCFDSGQPRWHGSRGRSRADARVRRSGRAVRWRRQPQRLVGRRHAEAVQAAHPVRDRSVLEVRGLGSEPERREHGRREHRGHRWRQALAGGISRAALERCGHRRRGWLHRGSAVLPRLRPSVVCEGAPGLREADGDHRCALARTLARQRRGVGDAGVCEDVPLQGGIEDAADERLRRLVASGSFDGCRSHPGLTCRRSPAASKRI